MTYDVYLHPKYLKKYQKLEDKDPQVYDFIKIGLNKLKKNPFDKENKKLKGTWKGYRRVKVDDYRIIYEIVYNKKLGVNEVNVIKFGPRKNVYVKSWNIFG